MKKLMFAAVIAASAAAFAAPLTAVDFEGANDYQPNESGSRFFFDGDSNSSVVTNTSPSTAKRTATYAEANNANYLALDTEGGTLWRSINDIATSPDYGLGTAQAVAATGTYLDTLVQFTVTEDEAPEVGEGDKLAIWLQAGEGTTNLMVKAGWTADGSLASGGTNFVLSGVTVQPGEWYRLTVKAYENILVENEELKFPAFSIFIDGTEVGVGGYTIDSTFAASLSELYLPGMASKVENGTVFLSCVAGEPGVSSALQGVGFQGTGAVDEIVWTEDNPIPAPASTVVFTLTGAENATVSYVIGSETSQTWDGSSTISVDSGATVTFTATPTNGYTYAGVTADGWTLTEGNMVCETNSTENITLAVPNAVALVTLTDPGIANATLTSPVLPAQYAPGATVELTWTAAPGYTFPNGQTTLSRTITVGTDDLAAIAAEVESSLSKQTFTVTITDIENATIAATTNNTDLVDALSENTTTNQYTVEYGATVTVTAEAAEGYEYATAPEGWTLNEGVLSIETNVTAAVELAAPVPTAKIATATVTVTPEGGTWNVVYGAVDGDSQEVPFPENVATVNVGTTITIEATPNTGYEYATVPTGWTAGQNGAITKTITVDDNVSLEIPAPTVTTIAIEPGAQGTATYTTEADAAAVTNTVTVAVPAAVSAAGVDATAYKANFEPKVVSDGNGGYKIEIGLTAAAEADLQTQANTDAGTLVSDITANTVTITTTPGFYYSVKYGSSLNAMNAQTAGVLADGATESITLPAKSGTSGFYKVVISIVPNEAVTP